MIVVIHKNDFTNKEKRIKKENVIIVILTKKLIENKSKGSVLSPTTEAQAIAAYIEIDC